jgi:hypothetical protein
MKCDFCSKKIKVISFDCKCNYKMLCSNCKFPEIHKCLSIEDIKIKEKSKISNNNPIIVAEKIIRI